MDRQKFYTALGSRIREFRQKNELTLDQLSKVSDLHLTKATLANIELGKQQVSTYQLVKLAAALRIPTSELLPPTSEQSILSSDMKDFSESL